MSYRTMRIVVGVILILAGWKFVDLILWGLGLLHITMPTIDVRDMSLAVASFLIGCLLALTIVALRKMRGIH